MKDEGFGGGILPTMDAKTDLPFLISHLSFGHCQKASKKSGPVIWPTSKAMANEKCEMINGK